MSPSDVVGADAVGNVEGLRRPQVVAQSTPQAGDTSSGATGFDDFFGDIPVEPALQRPTATRTSSSNVDPQFGKVGFSAAVGDVLVQLQAHTQAQRLVGIAPASFDSRHALATYKFNQALRGEPGSTSTLMRQMRAVTIDRSGFWDRPATIDLLPMMV
jgi:hypothetical protein